MSRPSPRIAKELKEIQSLPADSGLSACLVGSDMMHWKGTITGPDNTPYKGGVFCVDIVLPSDYPFVPPKMRFDTKVWHPNVSSANGAICLDILKSEWSPALTIRTALLSLQALLSCPNPDDPQDGVVAKQYKTDKALWEKTAKFWTEQHAKPPSTDNKQDEVCRTPPLWSDDALLWLVCGLQIDDVCVCVCVCVCVLCTFDDVCCWCDGLTLFILSPLPSPPLSFTLSTEISH